MAYSTNADVASLFKGLTFSSDTNPTDTEVDSFITEADQLIDAKVGTRYSTPVTGTNSLIVLKTISKYLVAADVQQILKVKSGGEKANQESHRDFRKVAMGLLKDIQEGCLLLSDATARSTGQGVKSFNVDCDIQHTFKRNTDQW